MRASHLHHHQERSTVTESPHDILDRLSADIETLRGFFPPPIPPDPDAIFKPRSFEKVEEAIEYWGLPTDMEYVPWDPDIDTDIGQALDRIGTNAVLVLEERTEPYPLDSSGGFPAYNVTAISGPNGTRTAITNKPARWFEMARGNILGLGPGEPSPSMPRSGTPSANTRIRLLPLTWAGEGAFI